MNIDENVQKVIKLLLRKWKLLILFMLIGAILAGVYTAKFTTLTYTSSVEFLAAAVDPAHEISDSTGEVAPHQPDQQNELCYEDDRYLYRDLQDQQVLRQSGRRDEQKILH